MYTLFV